MGPGKAELIEQIARTGSISAARAMGMSYRRAWQLVEALNKTFREPVITTAVGGARGGGARVSAFGSRIAADFRTMEGKASKAMPRIWNASPGACANRNGILARYIP